MFRNGREVVPEFDQEELLYLRYSAIHFVDEKLTPEAIRSDLNQSVNRGEFSEPADALFHERGSYNGLGVIGFKVGILPEKIEPLDFPAYAFKVNHVPIEDNYSHSELFSDQIPATGRHRVPGRIVKMQFKLKICTSITVGDVKIRAVR